MAKNKKDLRYFYTDGACRGNPGEGGWCSIELVPCEEGYITEIERGNKGETTNNEMELTAVYKCMLKCLRQGSKRLRIFSDSEYVVKAIKNGWVYSWALNNWKTKGGDEPKNLHIWEKVYKMIYKEGMLVDMVHVKGHSTDPINALADKIAVDEKNSIIGIL